MSERARPTKKFRYGARLGATIPLTLAMITVAGSMAYFGQHSVGYLHWVDLGMACLAALFAASLIRAIMVRVRGKHAIVVGPHELTAPSARTGRDVAIRYADIRKLELVKDKKHNAFARDIKIEHAGGEFTISGTMLGTTGELDEIYALIKAAR